MGKIFTSNELEQFTQFGEPRRYKKQVLREAQDDKFKLYGLRP